MMFSLWNKNDVGLYLVSPDVEPRLWAPSKKLYRRHVAHQLQNALRHLWRLLGVLSDGRDDKVIEHELLHGRVYAFGPTAHAEQTRL